MRLIGSAVAQKAETGDVQQLEQLSSDAEPYSHLTGCCSSISWALYGLAL